MEEDESHQSCIFCNLTFSSSVALVRENFNATLTLEKTLEMLWERVVGINVDTKLLFDVLTNEEGNWFCFQCLAVLHSAMGVVADILILEERLCSLSRRIRLDKVLFSYKQVNLSQNQLTDISFDDKSGTIGTAEHGISNSTGDTIPMGFDDLTDSVNTANDTEEVESEESQKSVSGLSERSKKRKHSNSSQGIDRNLTKPQPSKKKILKTDSACSTPLNIKSRPTAPKCTKNSSVQNCPSCEYKVDIRTLEQTAQSPESSPEILEMKSRYKLLEHCRDVHLSDSAMAKFTQMNKSVRNGNSFKCIDCPFTASKFNMVVLHYTSVHVPQHPVMVCVNRSSLSCPEKGCSFVSVVAARRPGPKCTLSPDSDREMREKLSVHVIKDHDRLELPARKYEASKSLIVITEGNNREYQCTRCDYEYRLPSLPDRISPALRRNSRRDFLKHFFDVHLKDSLCQ